jgi:NTP pyrophosphatase (non-canonical NTP hydrolase)
MPRKETNRLCACGCGEVSKSGFFAGQGHDAQYSRLTRKIAEEAGLVGPNENYTMFVRRLVEQELSPQYPKVTFPALRKANVDRCNQDFFPLEAWSPNDWGVALAGEVGEVCDALAKLRRVQMGAQNARDLQSEDDAVAAVAAELADAVIYADLVGARLGIDLEAEVQRKFNEVSDRKNSNVGL